MTKTELLGLLDEARGMLASYPQDSNEVCALLGRIEATLAEAEPPVEWQESVWVSWHGYPFGAARTVAWRLGLTNTNIQVRRARLDRWSWMVVRHGVTDTPEQAKEAALTAAWRAR